MAEIDLIKNFASLTLKANETSTKPRRIIKPKTCAETSDDEFESFESVEEYMRMRRNPANCFDHQYFFRTVNVGSALGLPDGSHQSRLGPNPIVESIDELREYVQAHNAKAHQSGPLISVATDLLRVLNLAWKYHCNGDEGIKILIIDSWQLEPKDFISCNLLRKEINLRENILYNNEFLIWGNIPAKAILHTWSWDDLSDSGLFKLFPALIGGDRYRSSQTLRQSIKSSTGTFSLAKTITILADHFKMDPSSTLIRQLSLMMLGWSKKLSYCYAKHFMTLQHNLSVEMPSEFQDLDIILYFKYLQLNSSLLDASLDFTEWWMVREREITQYKETLLGARKYAFLRYLRLSP